MVVVNGVESQAGIGEYFWIKLALKLRFNKAIILWKLKNNGY